MTGVLALDLSKRRTGWATWSPGHDRARFGNKVLGSEHSPDGLTFANLHHWLSELRMVTGFENIYLEQPIHPASLTGQTNIGTLRVLSGLAAHVHSFAAAMGLPQPVEVNIATWRRHFFGKMPRATKSAQLKRYAMDRCRQLGFAPRFDDEAEAIGILDFALDFHEHVTPPWRADEVLRPPMGAVG